MLVCVCVRIGALQEEGGMYISKEGLDNLKYYKYSGQDKSFLANWFLKKHWDWCTVTFFPVWMAYCIPPPRISNQHHLSLFIDRLLFSPPFMIM